MNNSNFELSLDDTTELKKLIIENPELPLLIFAGEDTNIGEHAYEQAEVKCMGIKELTLYNNMWIEKDDFSDELYDSDEMQKKYSNLSDKEYVNAIDNEIEKVEFVKAIVVNIN